MTERHDTPPECWHPLLVDRREAARLLGVSTGTIGNLQQSGDLDPVRIGTRVLDDVADLRRLIDRKKGGAA